MRSRRRRGARRSGSAARARSMRRTPSASTRCLRRSPTTVLRVNMVLGTFLFEWDIRAVRAPLLDRRARRSRDGARARRGEIGVLYRSDFLSSASRGHGSAARGESGKARRRSRIRIVHRDDFAALHHAYELARDVASDGVSTVIGSRGVTNLFSRVEHWRANVLSRLQAITNDALDLRAPQRRAEIFLLHPPGGLRPRSS